MKKRYIILLAAVIGLTACKKIQNGFQSDNIRYKDNNLYAKRGLILYQSDRINADGSTPPYTFKLLNLRKADGSAAPAEFTKTYKITVFKAGQSFVAETDTTVALLNKKRETIDALPMSFNETSGQLTFNKASANLPLGQYKFDVQMTNPTGTKLFKDLATINVVDPSTDDLFVVTDNVANGFNDVTGAVTPMKTPLISCRKISNDGARVILKMSDKNGRAFNPKAGEIIKRGDRPTFENYAKFNPVIVTDTAMICDFEIAPFPLTKYVTPTTDWGFLMYYRIPSTYAKIDNFPTNVGFSINPRWSWQLKLEGTYIVEIRFTDATKK